MYEYLRNLTWHDYIAVMDWGVVTYFCHIYCIVYLTEMSSTEPAPSPDVGSAPNPDVGSAPSPDVGSAPSQDGGYEQSQQRQTTKIVTGPGHWRRGDRRSKWRGRGPCIRRLARSWCLCNTRRCEHRCRRSPLSTDRNNHHTRGFFTDTTLPYMYIFCQAG